MGKSFGAFVIIKNYLIAFSFTKTNLSYLWRSEELNIHDFYLPTDVSISFFILLKARNAVLGCCLLDPAFLDIFSNPIAIPRIVRQ